MTAKSRSISNPKLARRIILSVVLLRSLIAYGIVVETMFSYFDFVGPR